MKKLFLFLSLITAIFVNCKNTPSGTNAETSGVETAKSAVDTLCFEFKLKNDITSCQLIVDGDKVNGYFDWTPYEKDGGHGILENGVKKGDMITVDWKMMIEGTVQTEQLVFKLDGEKLYQMDGDLEEKDGKIVLKSPETAKVGDILMKVNCSSIEPGIERAKSAVEMMKNLK